MKFYDLRSALSETRLGEMTNTNECIDSVMLVLQNMLFSVDVRKFENFRLINIVSSESGFTFTWESKSTSSTCPRCGTISYSERHTYNKRVVIDEPILGLPVMHCLKVKLYFCHHCIENGSENSFVENISSICRRPYIKTTTNLDERIVNDGIDRSANGLADDYDGNIRISPGTILNRIKEAGGMVTEKNLTETENVKVLSVDDNNARKGASSTANTVVVDIDRHIILVVAKGADSEVAKEIFKRFPEAEKLSRDRACAYSKAGNDCGLEQVADIFHLVSNAHDAVKEALSKGLDYNIYTKEGDGWVELPFSAPLPEVSGEAETVLVTTLTDDDITRRVHLASISAKQEKKYRTVIELLRLHDQGLSSREIDSRLGITRAERTKLYSEAADVINGVEEKIDEYFANSDKGKTRQKTIGKRSKPSSDSIVAPYEDVVMKMVSEGGNHRNILPVIQELGYTGSPNAIYQYILKKRNEDALDTNSNTTTQEGVMQRPPKVSIQRVTKTAVYKFVLHEAAVRRESKKNEEICEVLGVESNLQPDLAIEKDVKIKSSAFYSDSVASIISGTKKEPTSKKKVEKPDYNAVAEKNPIVGESIDFLFDLHHFIDNADIQGLDQFIIKYTASATVPFVTYAKGIKEDYDSVKNAILNRDVNNGMIEGFNDKIKLLRKIRYGRAKEELINAVSVLSTQPRFRYHNYPVVKYRKPMQVA